MINWIVEASYSVSEFAIAVVNIGTWIVMIGTILFIIYGAFWFLEKISEEPNEKPTYYRPARKKREPYRYTQTKPRTRYKRKRH